MAPINVTASIENDTQQTGRASHLSHMYRPAYKSSSRVPHRYRKRYPAHRAMFARSWASRKIWMPRFASSRKLLKSRGNHLTTKANYVKRVCSIFVGTHPFITSLAQLGSDSLPPAHPRPSDESTCLRSRADSDICPLWL